MRETAIIDGKAFAEGLRARIKSTVAELKERHGLTPGLAVVLVGNDPASEIYVRNKGIATREAGMASFELKLPEETTESDLLGELARLNRDPSVHGILVQMPLPKHISSERIIDAIDPQRDVDGLTPLNAGRLASGRAALVPCTPQGSLMLIKSVVPDIRGLDALVIGRSVLVGRPVAQLLLAEDATVTIAHSKTRGLEARARAADILVAAIGKPEFVRGHWVKQGAIVIDVGINRIEGAGGKGKIVGDVATTEAMGRAAAITPVPKGVGPMTIACLLRNTALAACARGGIDPTSVGL
ncbi:MAG: bifunctional methylenetetrahydrofolate dehydrogenase/methenyltetrahydrofolate cyclohydrolase FolD [Alphaproteobacteria bacterium]